jgi:exoribonuclease R
VAQVPFVASAPSQAMTQGFRAIRAELDLPEAFPSEVLAEAENVVAQAITGVQDMTHVPLVTLDPAGAKDLDQALHIERRGSGYTVWYAIADVPTFAQPGGAVDTEAHRRGVTYYSPDRKVPLHPPLLSEDQASLLAGVDRPAYLWRLDLDEDGDIVDVDVRRAMVRSRGQYDYISVQQDLTGDRADDVMALLSEVGALRQQLEVDRGGVSLALPRQLVVSDENGYRLVSETPAPVEGFNAQISLMTGMAAAQLMLDAGVGILRVMPAPSDNDQGRVRGVARTLGLDWPKDMPYPDFVRSLDPDALTTTPMLLACTTLMRGAGYQVIGESATLTKHAAVASSYAHVTAPLRRLVDRYGLAVCAALCADEPIPEWVMEGIDSIPDVMTQAGGRARSLERANIDLVEAGVLAGREGEVFDAVGISSRQGSGIVHVVAPAVIAECEGDVPLGEPVSVRLDEADMSSRKVRFSRA